MGWGWLGYGGALVFFAISCRKLAGFIFLLAFVCSFVMGEFRAKN